MKYLQDLNQQLLDSGIRLSVAPLPGGYLLISLETGFNQNFNSYYGLLRALFVSHGFLQSAISDLKDAYDRENALGRRSA